MIREALLELSEYISPKQARDFSHLLRGSRIALGKTQEEVAREIGLSQHFVSSAERLSPASGVRFLEMLILLRYYNIEPNVVARLLGLAGPWSEEQKKETPDHSSE